jgi:HEAT repeat protein
MRDFEEDVAGLGTDTCWQQSYRRLDGAGADALEAVLRGMSHPNWRVRRWCTAFMDHHGDARCVRALCVALKDENSNVRRHAVHSIGCQGCKQTPLNVDIVALLIERMEHDENSRVRQVAAHMLGNQPTDARAISSLRQIVSLAQDPKLLSRAKWSLERQMSRSVRQVCTRGD